MRINKYVFITLILSGWIINLEACTIFSGKDNKGHVWAGNNEDMVFTFNTYLNLVAGSDSTLGYAFLTYYSPNGFIQGGVNEEGLFLILKQLHHLSTRITEKRKISPEVIERCFSMTRQLSSTYRSR